MEHSQPISPTEFHILLALADSPRHGYGIMQEVGIQTDGAVRLGPGTLYGAVKRMLAAGLIEESGRRPVASQDDRRRRRYYRLTASGRKAASEETRRMAALVRMAQVKRLAGSNTLAAEPPGA